MGTEWMGRYRAFVSALVWHGNEYLRMANEKNIDCNGHKISSIEWQIVEYLIDHPNSDNNMAQIAYDLGLSTSTFSKLVSGLVRLGLVEKYQKVGNRKDVIIRASTEGKTFYEENAVKIMYPLFEKSFEMLSSLSDEQLDSVVGSMKALRYIQENPVVKKELRDEDLIPL